MTEWYVYCEGGIPVIAEIGRREAMKWLMNRQAMTAQDKIRLRLISEGGLPDIASPIQLGTRSITRVLGPGTEV